MNRVISVLILIVGLAVVGVGLYPYIKKPDPPVIQNQTRDMSETYGIVRGTVFNKKTLVVFRHAPDYFADAGVSNFENTKFDVFGKLPPGVKNVDGTPLTEKEIWTIEHREKY